MPYINVKLNCKKDESVKEKIVELILENTSFILGKKREITSIFVEFVSEDSWYINNKNEKTFYLDIKITKGTNSKDEKSEYINKTYLDFKDLLGDINKASYILIDEIEADSWGFEGLTQEYRYIQSKKIKIDVNE
jgi:4-oxalocrotonate tautomerase